MKEIQVKENPTTLCVYINGVPNLELIPKDEADIVIAALECQISEFIQKE